MEKKQHRSVDFSHSWTLTRASLQEERRSSSEGGEGINVHCSPRRGRPGRGCGGCCLWVLWTPLSYGCSKLSLCGLCYCFLCVCQLSRLTQAILILAQWKCQDLNLRILAPEPLPHKTPLQ